MSKKKKGTPTAAVSAGKPTANIGTATKPSTSDVRLWVTVVALIVGTLVVFWPALGHTFVDWDDPTYVYKNPLILHPTSAAFGKLATQIVSLNYHPVTMWSLWANAALSGTAAAKPFILTNLWLHAFNVALVFLFVYALSERRYTVALLTALLFGWHPLRVESVVWISERKDVLYVFWMLLGFLVYLWRQKVPKWWHTSALYVLFALACLSKATAVVFPVVLLLIDDWYGRFNRQALVEKISMFVVSLFFGVMALNVQSGGNFYGLLHTEAPQDNAIGNGLLSFGERLLYGGYGYGAYWLKTFFAQKISPFYPYPFQANLQPNVPLNALGLLFLVGSLAAAFWARKRQKVWWFGLAFFVVTIALVLQFISVGQVAMADRYSYLPSVGLWFMLTYAVGVLVLQHRPISWRTAWWAVAGLLVLFYTVQTRRYLPVWQNTETLWQRASAYCPAAAYPYQALGNWYGEQGRIAEAKTVLEKAVVAPSVKAAAFSGLANCYMILQNQQRDTTGRTATLEKVRRLYDQAIALEPNNGDHYFNRGISFIDLHPEQALTDFQQAQQYLGSRQAVVRLYMGICHLNKQNYATALPLFDEAIKEMTALPLDKQPSEIRDNLPFAYRSRAVARFNSGDKANARVDIKAARRLQPNDAGLQQLEQQMGQ